MQLKTTPRHPNVTVGRGDEEAIPINDATLSRVHLTLKRSASGWTVEDSNSSNGSWLDGMKLEPGRPYPLKDGAAIQGGRVYLTYFEPSGISGACSRVRGTGCPNGS